MRKNILSLSIAAMIGGLGFAGAASASVLTTSSGIDAAGAAVVQAAGLNVTSGGTGHILVVPYYSVQNSNATLVNLVNTDAINGKEVKIRFRGASNSDDVLDFTLYMSPSDMWSFKVQADGNGLANLITYDRSCTTLPLAVPSAVPGTAFGFPTGRLPVGYTAAQKAAETREGYIEILNTANIPPALQAGQIAVTGVAGSPLFNTVKHAAGVPACNTALLTALASADFKRAIATTAAGVAAPAGEASASASGLVSPTGGLFANSTVLNLTSTLTFTQPATAITAVTVAGGSVAGAGYIIHSPQQSISVAAAGGTYLGADAGIVTDTTANGSTADPLLRSANNARVTAGAYVGLTSAIITPLYQDLPDLSTPYTTASAATAAGPLAQAAALTASLAAKSVMNEYQTVVSIGGATDWTFSMPTRRYSVAMDYVVRASAATADGRVFTNLAGVAGDLPATTATTLATPSASRYFAIDNTAISAFQICVAGDATNGVQTYGREEETTSAGITISPGSTTTPAFCGEVSVASFNVGNVTGASVLGATLARQDFPMIGVEGWSRVSTLGLGTAAIVTAANANGLPVIGASYMKATGASSNYGLIANHRYTR